MGKAPTHTTLAGVSNSGLDYRRDTDTLVFSGTGLGLMTGFEIVDAGGSVISVGGVPVTSATTDDGIVATTTSVTVSPTALNTGFTQLERSWIDDSRIPVADGQRRIKVTTPWGSVISAVTDAFTISATPDISATATAAYAGTGSGGTTGFSGPNTYDSVTGELVINDINNNFQGTKTISFEHTNGTVFHTVNVDPDNPPVGIWFDTDGSKLSVTKAYIDTNCAIWANSGGAASSLVRVTVAGSRPTPDAGASVLAEDVSPALITTGTTLVFTITGTGYTAPNFLRSGTLTATYGSDLAAAYGTTGDYAVLVDKNGNELGGVAGRVILGTGLTVSGAVATIAADMWDTDGYSVDSIKADRHIRLVDVDTGNTLTSLVSFSVHSLPVISATQDTAFFETGGVVNGYVQADNMYKYSAGTAPNVGDLIINTTGGLDMKGVKTIAFWETTTGDEVDGTTTLTPSDWTVDATGAYITIPAATMLDKGAAWYAGPVNYDRQLRLGLPDGTTVSTPTITTQP